MFRFEQLDIWQRSCDIGSDLCDVAEELDKRKFYRFGEQMRAAALSISNNIAEGSGSDSNADFKNFLNYARRSVFEVASMLLFFRRKGYLSSFEPEDHLSKLEELSKMINAFRKSL